MKFLEQIQHFGSVPSRTQDHHGILSYPLEAEFVQDVEDCGQYPCYQKALPKIHNNFTLMSMSGNRRRLWSESPTTLPYTSPNINFPKSKRFQRNSIYWPLRNQESLSARGLKNMWDEEIKAISKKIDDEQKVEKFNEGREPMRRLSLIIRPLEERMHERRLTHFMKSVGSTDATFNNTVTTRLFQKQPKGPLSPKRDRRGLRSDEIVVETDCGSPSPYPSKQLSNSVDLRKRGFSSSSRMDLSRPYNFNPGPGTYRIVRFLDQKKLVRKQSKKDQIG